MVEAYDMYSHQLAAIFDPAMATIAEDATTKAAYTVWVSRDRTVFVVRVA